MNLTKKGIFYGILVFGLIVNLLVFFDVNQLYLRAIITFIFLTTIPGLLLMLLLKIREIDVWKYLVYVIGLSVAFLIFGGLFINWILPLIGIERPLSSIPLLISFDIFLLIFWFIAYRRNKKICLKIQLQKLSNLNRAFFIIPLVFPVLSIFGAVNLNNNGPNYLTMIMIASISLYFLIVILFRNKLNKNIYPFSILIISISLLLMVSLRSQYVSGWDIYKEYYVFQLTKEGFNWSMSNYSDAYNACLSVTILPTVLSSLLKINDYYIFKLLFQLIFSFISVGVFLFIRRFAKNVVAFIASLFFISQSTFFAHHTKAVRQEIAFLFFTLSLLILFSKSISSIKKKSLFLVFGFSIIVSHYTTAYITIALFIFTYLISFIFRKTENKRFFSKIYEKLNLRKKGIKLAERKQYLSMILIIILIVFAVIWYVPVTRISGDLVDIAKGSIQNIGKTFSAEAKEEGLSFSSQWNIFYKPEDKTPLLQDYIKEINLDYKSRTYLSLYSPEEYGDYSPELMEDLGIIVPKLSANTVSKIYIFIELIKKLMKVFIIIGFFYLLFFQLKKRNIEMEYIFLCLTGLFGIVVMMILPVISIKYSAERFYHQNLIFLSLLIITGSSVVFKFIREKYRIVMISIIVLLYYLFFTGFIPQIIGGVDAPFQLNNYGVTYDEHYTHKTEVVSSDWLMNNWDNESLVYADKFAEWRLLAFGKFTLVFDDVLPSTIDRNSYIYLRNSNVVKNLNFKRYKGQGLNFNYPTEFLNQNKNLIYNNGGSEIYK